MEKINKIFIGGGYSFPNSKKRVGWIDIAKAIAILCIVFGHSMNGTNKIETISVAIIYTFHVPVFFLLSSITCRYSTDFKSFKQNTLKAMKHLLVPAYLIYLVAIIYSIYLDPNKFYSFQFWKEYILGAVYYTSIPVEYMGLQMPAIFASWFFIALFLSRVIFDYLQMIIPKAMLFPIVLLTSCIGVALGKHEIFILSFDIALAVLPFIYLGYIWKNLEKHNISSLSKVIGVVICFFIWIIFSLFTYKDILNIVGRRYPLYPLCIIAALAGSYSIIVIAKQLEKAKIFLPFQFLGRYCIYFYSIHCIDNIWIDWYKITNNDFLNFLTRVAIDLAFFLVVVVIHISITKIIKAKKLKKKLQ